MKNLILSLLAIGTIGFITGCACDDKKSCDNSASYDNKDMHHRHHMDNQ